MRKCDVILVEAGGTVGYQVMRSLVAKGMSVAICDVRADGMAFHSRFSRGRRFLIPSPLKRESDYVKVLKEQASALGASVIIPIFHPEVLADHRDEFVGVKIPVAPAAILRLLDDKKSASGLAFSLDIPTPRFYSSPSEIDDYPMVFKRVKGQGGDAVYFPKSEQALTNLMSKSREGSYLMMEFVDGYDVCVDAIRYGDFFVASAYKVHFPKSKGVSIIRESMSDETLFEYARLMMETTGFEGVCGFDFRYDHKSGRYLFLECNPRFSGGIASAISSGLNLPLLLLEATDGHPLVKPSIKDGVVSKNWSSASLWKRRHPDAAMPKMTVHTYEDLPFDDIPALLFSVFRKR